MIAAPSHGSSLAQSVYGGAEYGRFLATGFFHRGSHAEATVAYLLEIIFLYQILRNGAAGHVDS